MHHAATQLADLLAREGPKISAAHINALTHEWQKRWAATTAHTRIGCLRRILREIDQTTGTRLTSGLPKTRTPEPRSVTVTPEEYERLLTHAKPHMRLFLLLTGTLALRFSEALNLTGTNYSEDTGTISLQTKGGFWRTFPVPEHIRQILRASQHLGKGTFIERLAAKPITRWAILCGWRRLKKKAGISPAVVIHDLRRSAAVEMYRATHNLFAVKALLGHNQLSSTIHYLKANESEGVRIAAQHLESAQAAIAAARKDALN